MGMTKQTLSQWDESGNDPAAEYYQLSKQLEQENHWLRSLLEDLVNDKLIQAQRIKELEHEKSLLKQTLADLIFDQHHFKEEFGKK